MIRMNCTANQRTAKRTAGSDLVRTAWTMTSGASSVHGRNPTNSSNTWPPMARRLGDLR